MIIGIDASRANHEQKTGVEGYAYHIIQELKKQETRNKKQTDNIQYVLYTDQPLKGELANLPRNWTQKVLRWWPRRFWTQIRLSLEMLLHPPDVLFIPAHVFPIIHPKKTVMTVHDVAALRFKEAYSWFERWYSIWSAKQAVKKLWKVIVPSEFTKSVLSSQFLALSSNNIIVIPHGYDERYMKDIRDSQDIEQILNRYSICQPFLLSIGRLEEKKNTRRIIEAFSILKKNISPISNISANIQLVLIGKPGYGYQKVKEAIEKSPYKKDIIIPGWVDNNDLPTVLEAAEVFVFPSLYEGFGLPVLEAFAAGIPVIASRETSLEEVGGQSVYLVAATDIQDIASGIQEILSNSALRNQLSKEGLERLKQFSWQSAADKTLQTLLN